MGRCVKKTYYIDIDFTTKLIESTTSSTLAIGSAETSYNAFIKGAYIGCEKVDDLLACIQCRDGFSLYSGRCCANKKILVKLTATPEFKCIDADIDNALNCDVFEGFNIEATDEAAAVAARGGTSWDFTCRTCSQNNYLTSNKNCCPFYNRTINGAGFNATNRYDSKTEFDCLDTKGVIGCLYYVSNTSDSC